MLWNILYEKENISISSYPLIGSFPDVLYFSEYLIFHNEWQLTYDFAQSHRNYCYCFCYVDGDCFSYDTFLELRDFMFWFLVND